MQRDVIVTSGDAADPGDLTRPGGDDGEADGSPDVALPDGSNDGSGGSSSDGSGGSSSDGSTDTSNDAQDRLMSDLELGTPDRAVSPDAAAPTPDAAPTPSDAAPPPPGPTPVACGQGPGSSLFQLHWGGGSHSAQVDVWEANCEYSLAPGSACNALPICRGGIGCEVGTAMMGYALALEGGNEYLQIRFDVTRLFFNRVTVYIQARSLSPGATSDLEFWSPLYGGGVLEGISQEFEYHWYWVDWSDYLQPGDDPGLTAIRFTPAGGAGAVGLHAVEVCLE